MYWHWEMDEAFVEDRKRREREAQIVYKDIDEDTEKKIEKIKALINDKASTESEKAAGKKVLARLESKQNKRI